MRRVFVLFRLNLFNVSFRIEFTKLINFLASDTYTWLAMDYLEVHNEIWNDFTRLKSTKYIKDTFKTSQTYKQYLKKADNKANR